MDQRVLWFYTPVALLAPYGATRKHPISMGVRVKSALSGKISSRAIAQNGENRKLAIREQT